MEVKRRERKLLRSVEREEQAHVDVSLVNVDPVNAIRSVPSVSLDVKLDADLRNNFICKFDLNILYPIIQNWNAYVCLPMVHVRTMVVRMLKQD